MCVFVCLCVQPVSRSKDYVRSGGLGDGGVEVGEVVVVADVGNHAVDEEQGAGVLEEGEEEVGGGGLMLAIMLWVRNR